MATVRVTQEFLAAHPGELHPRPVAVGSEVSGELAEIARRNGWGDVIDASGNIVVPETVTAEQKAEIEAAFRALADENAALKDEGEMLRAKIAAPDIVITVDDKSADDKAPDKAVDKAPANKARRAPEAK